MGKALWPLAVIAAIAGVTLIGWQTRSNEQALAIACVNAGKEWKLTSFWTTSYGCVATGEED